MSRGLFIFSLCINYRHVKPFFLSAFAILSGLPRRRVARDVIAPAQKKTGSAKKSRLPTTLLTACQA
jgi:hypothetical protein